ncbi:MAG TPA: CYCXC family (seleno)protein [Candidatus Acidoferrales bacterium]|nr:CYCXC family (seleno)protein [Candidatus Acidoferrales bacterium]
MTKRSRIIFAAVVFAAAVAMAAAAVPIVRAERGLRSRRIAAQATIPRTMSPSGAESSANSIPGYHPAPPKGPLPATLPARGFTDPLTKKAYAIAAKIKPVLYQLPCYCRCDRAAGHTSLLSCYGDTHGSECEICKKELFYAYEQHRKGKTAPQIRAGIIHGDWQQVNLSKYAPPLVPGK